MTDRTVVISLKREPEKDYSFSLVIPELFAPPPMHVIALPGEGNEAHVYRQIWYKYTDNTCHEVRGWRIEYKGPYFNQHGNHSKTELPHEWLVGASIQQTVKRMLEEERDGSIFDDDCVEEKPLKKRPTGSRLT